MILDLRGKLVVAVTGTLLAIVFFVFFPLWMALLAILCMVPFFTKVLLH
ncbi:hypothetical protein OB955_21275 [Halobacteria archaeon AArc-m2/3/4]|uniref:Uncharacterized protein n=1 Tax=Natronoglomus mannanivorans TaxID=2979990 RepID=A0AAP2Z3S5_9EURY|nr:hypothetical protein [Halobacteria archaeon AArc-xg1-1]MCU4975237.1 hypothetical protein [Halobacteria archaeon AArc-m2/3/4]